MTVDIEFFRELAYKLLSQDNAMTADPIWIVQEEKTIYGIEDDYADDYIWCRDDGDFTEATASQARRLELVYRNSCKVRDGWLRIGVKRRWETVQPFLTLDAARDYIKTQGHNHGELRVYAESASRNAEMRKLREQIIAIEQFMSKIVDLTVELRRRQRCHQEGLLNAYTGSQNAESIISRHRGNADALCQTANAIEAMLGLKPTDSDATRLNVGERVPGSFWDLEWRR